MSEISEAIATKGLTDAKLAEQVGCDRSMITKIRAGTVTPSLPLALKLSAALSIPVSAFDAKSRSAA